VYASKGWVSPPLAGEGPSISTLTLSGKGDADSLPCVFFTAWREEADPEDRSEDFEFVPWVCERPITANVVRPIIEAMVVNVDKLRFLLVLFSRCSW
jgi:hypothetical protein